MTMIVQQPVQMIPGSVQGQVVVSVAEASSVALNANGDGGVYDLWCDVDVWILVAPTTPGTTNATGYLIRANTTIPVWVKSGWKIWAIAGGAGTLRYMRTGHIA